MATISEKKQVSSPLVDSIVSQFKRDINNAITNLFIAIVLLLFVHLVISTWSIESRIIETCNEEVSKENR